MSTTDPRTEVPTPGSSQPPMFDAPAEKTPAGRSARRDALEAPPLDKTRARQACAPMGKLHSIVASVDGRRRRRIWYIIDPDFALANEYRAQGLALFPGCKVLVDARLMKAVAVLDLDPSTLGPGVNSPLGFNPYFDLPGG